MRSQIVISNRGRGGRRYAPYACTEHGALMAATVLNSPRAVAMSIYIVKAFVKMREDLATNAAILKRVAEIEKTLLIHDSVLRVVQKLRPLSHRLSHQNLKSVFTSKKTGSLTGSKGNGCN